MSKLKEKFPKTLKTKKGFGNIFDIFQHIAFFQVVYSVLLTINYNMYQGNKVEFQPVIYYLMIILVGLIIVFEKLFVERWKLILAEAAVSIILTLILPVSSKFWFLSGCLVICLRSIIKFNYRFSDSETYSERFRSLNKVWLNVIIIILSFLFHLFSSDYNPELISPNVCNIYLMASFEIFIIMNIMTKFSFKFYEYYRQNRINDLNSNKNIRYSFFIILFASIVLVTTIFILFGNLFVPILNKILVIILRIIGSFFLLGFHPNNEYFDEEMSGEVVTDTKLNIKSGKNLLSDSQINLIAPMVILFLVICAILFAAWKLYKGLLANYKTQEDVVEFVPIRDYDTEYKYNYNKTKPYKFRFGKTNIDKVRKLYFDMVYTRTKKYDISIKASRTPKEISSSLVQKESEKDILTDMTEMYEKARYSNDDISDDEVSSMREWSKKI